MQNVVKSRAAASVFRRERETEKAEVAHGKDGVDGELVRPIPRLDVRCDLGLRELADHLAERLLLVGQLEVHRDARP